MKRSAALAPLSRDHHHALVVAARLRRATPETAADATDAFLEYWERDGRQHFREEEEILLPAYAEHASPHRALVARVLVEHVQIRALANTLHRSDELELSSLQELGVQLADHVRLEERELFPIIEKALPAAALERVLRLLVPPLDTSGDLPPAA
jgi:hemerythrin-like domain-containing protein